jgi:iron(III) transport system substrate-binding protein
VNISGVVLAKVRSQQGERDEADRVAGRRAGAAHVRGHNYEYPVRSGIAINPTIAGYGKLNPDTLDLEDRREQEGGGEPG